jgi:uncharacterized protein
MAKNSNPIVHFEIMGKNPKKLFSFYKAFGWKVDARNPQGYGMVPGGGKDTIGGGITKGKGVTVYLQVKDLEKSLAAVKKAGGKIVMKPTEIPGMEMSMAMFKDPAGNVVGMIA